MEGYGPTTYGDRFADVYDSWYADLGSPAEAAAFVGRRATGTVIELGSGTGRISSPIRAGGHAVVGLDASEAMLRRSVHRDPSVPVVVADMTGPPFRDGSAGAVLVAFNTLFNLPSDDAQRGALQRIAEVLAPGAPLVVEAFVPGTPEDEDPSPSGTDDRVDVVRLEADVVVLRISRTDHAAGTVSGQHVELRDGAPVRLRPWHLRFRGPDELDEMAADAGLVLAERFADWAETPFDDHSGAHVSVYRGR